MDHEIYVDGFWCNDNTANVDVWCRCGTDLGSRNSTDTPSFYTVAELQQIEARHLKEAGAEVPGSGDITVYVPAGYDGPEAVFTDEAEANRYQAGSTDIEGIWELVLNRWPGADQGEDQ